MTVAVTTTGRVYGRGDCARFGFESAEGFKLCPSIPSDVVIRQLAAPVSGSHALMLSDSGVVYVIGSGKDGQLGLKTTFVAPVATKVAMKERAVCVAASAKGSAAITASGKFFTWGKDTSHGELCWGPQRTKSHRVPALTLLSAEDASVTVKFTKVAIGVNHSALLTDEGCVVTVGGNSHGQCGMGASVAPIDVRGLRPLSVPCFSPFLAR
jgi:alpha-tubulin suppressor-like RCC1 family protein